MPRHDQFRPRFAVDNVLYGTSVGVFEAISPTAAVQAAVRKHPDQHGELVARAANERTEEYLSFRRTAGLAD